MRSENLSLASMTASANSPQVDTWIQWTHVFCFVDGIALSIYSKIKSGTMKNALKALHVCLKGIDDEFIKVIDALKKDPSKIPSVPINPSPIIQWDDDPSIFEGILGMVNGALSETMTILASHASEKLQTVIHAVDALRRCMEDVINELKKHNLTINC